MSEPDKIQKLEETVKFLRKELESQNMAILRLERILESGDSAAVSKDKPALTLADIEYVIFGIEEKLKKHNDLIKNIAISLVGTTDMLEEIRELYRNSVNELRLDQEDQMKSYQKILSGSLETIRTEFLLVLRDFREKYPELEAIKHSKAIDAKKESPSNVNTRKLESAEAWTENQLQDLNQRMENMELVIEQNIQANISSVYEMLNHLQVKLEQVYQTVTEEKVVKKNKTSM